MSGSLSLSLKWAHNAVCSPADRFQMLMAGSWCEGVVVVGGSYSSLLGKCGGVQPVTLTENAARRQSPATEASSENAEKW